MSFVVKGSFGEIEVDCIINGLITPNKMIMFNAMLVDGRKIFVGIAPINKGYQEALEQIQEINKILEGANCKKEKASARGRPLFSFFTVCTASFNAQDKNTDHDHQNDRVVLFCQLLL